MGKRSELVGDCDLFWPKPLEKEPSCSGYIGNEFSEEEGDPIRKISEECKGCEVGKIYILGARALRGTYEWMEYLNSDGGYKSASRSHRGGDIRKDDKLNQEWGVDEYEGGSEKVVLSNEDSKSFLDALEEIPQIELQLTRGKTPLE